MGIGASELDDWHWRLIDCQQEEFVRHGHHVQAKQISPKANGQDDRACNVEE